MPPQLSKKPVIKRDLLLEIAEGRLEDARALLTSGRFAAAVYLGGYAVECLLKAAICTTLDIDELTETFKVHDLELLLLYSGLARRMQADHRPYEAFRKLEELWNEEVRYEHPSRYTEGDAESFLGWVDEVIAWIRKRN